MDSLPNEILCNILRLLDTRILLQARRVCSHWLKIATIILRNRPQVTLKLTSRSLPLFDATFSKCIDFPLGNFTFTEELLSSSVCFSIIKEFIAKYGKFITKFQVISYPGFDLDENITPYKSRGEGDDYEGDDEDDREYEPLEYSTINLLDENMRCILTEAKNIEEVILQTSYPLPALGLPKLPKIKTVSIDYYRSQSSSEKCLLLELANLPGLSKFKFRDHCFKKILDALTLLENNPNVLVSHRRFYIVSPNPYSKFLDQILDTKVKFEELRVTVEGSGGSEIPYFWTKLSNWMSFQSNSLVNLYLGGSRPSYGLLKVKSFPVLKKLELSFVALLPTVCAEQFPNLKILIVESAFIDIFAKCVLGSVTTLVISDTQNVCERRKWRQILPNVTNLQNDSEDLEMPAK